MNTIQKLNVCNNDYEPIAVFSSEWTRKLEELGAPDAMLKMCTEVPMGPQEVVDLMEAETQSMLAHWCADGFYHNGRNFKPMFAGSSDIRKATSVWLDETLIPTMGKWAMCGINTKTMKIAVNKYMAYIGLLASASKPFAEVFGKPVDIRRVVVIKDAEVVVKATVDLVSAETGVTHDQARSLVINAFDGLGIIRHTLTKGESVTLRGPWIKAFALAFDFTALAKFAFQNGKKPEVTDLWGNTVSLKDVDVILTESCFKAAKLYDGWTQYQDAFEELGHAICVCVREHAPRLKGMPYQQGQTLMGTEDDAMRFMQHAKSTVYKYSDPAEAAKLLRGYHKAAAKLYPALLNEKHTQNCIQEKYASKRTDMLGGRIPELGYNAFLAPDPVAFAEHVFGMEIKGFLKAGECCCLPAKEGPVDVTRNPHLDNAHVLLTNRKDVPFTMGPTMYINILDMTTVQLRADYDGDHVWYSQDEHLLDLVKRTYEKIHNLPVDWSVGKAPKVSITKSAIAEFVKNLLHGSEIGIYADAMTKMWNSTYSRDTCAWLTFAGNVLIDAAKHASVKVKKPDDVLELNKIPLPNFARYAKADSVHPADSPYWDEVRKFTGTPRCAYSGSFLDMYSKFVEENVSETLEIKDIKDEVFDHTVLMFKPNRKQIPGIFKKGRYNIETGTYEDTGLFQQIAFRHTEEWNRLMKSDSAMLHRDEWEYECRKEALQEIVFYCRSLYANHDLSKVSDDEIINGAYDTICRFIFTSNMSDGMRTVVMQAFWRIFGDRVVEALKKNLHTNDFVDVDFDDDDELFDCEE